jgi:protein-S-isoprenylcysteine O-methyltransferase Ste14
MYSAALVLTFAMPIALGSWWGLLFFPPVAAVITWRLLEEEKFLVNRLPGYAEYRRKVPYRLLPLIW